MAGFSIGLSVFYNSKPFEVDSAPLPLGVEQVCSFLGVLPDLDSFPQVSLEVALQVGALEHVEGERFLIPRLPLQMLAQEMFGYCIP